MNLEFGKNLKKLRRISQKILRDNLISSLLALTERSGCKLPAGAGVYCRAVRKLRSRTARYVDGYKAAVYA